MASGESGLTSRRTPLLALAQSSSSSTSPKAGVTTTPSSSSQSASPSLAQLAAINAPPRRSLANLATSSSTPRTPTSTTSSLATAGARTGSPSLSQLASQGGAAAAAPRRSLASLAQSSSTPTTTTATRMAAAGGGSSLSQLANASNIAAPPRRSLVGLAASSSSAVAGTKTCNTGITGSLSVLSGTPSIARPGTVGLTLRSGGGLVGLSRTGSGSGALRKDVLDESSASTASSPSLVDLAAGGEGRVKSTTVSLSGLGADKSSGSLGGLSKLAGSASSANRTTHKPSVSRQEGNAAAGAGAIPVQETMMQSEEVSDSGHMSMEVIDYSHEDDSTSATSAFSSLIAAPSHFAISIFEKLESVPSPLARSTATQIQADPAVRYGGYSVGVEGAGGGATVRMFTFDVPSPDDVVFKAQGQRPAATRT